MQIARDKEVLEIQSAIITGLVEILITYQLMAINYPLAFQ